MTQANKSPDPNMYFGPAALETLARDFESITQKHAKLMHAFLMRPYREPRGKEFAQHGFMRRIKSMARAINNVFPSRT